MLLQTRRLRSLCSLVSETTQINHLRRHLARLLHHRVPLRILHRRLGKASSTYPRHLNQVLRQLQRLVFLIVRIYVVVRSLICDHFFQFLPNRPMLAMQLVHLWFDHLYVTDSATASTTAPSAPAAPSGGLFGFNKPADPPSNVQSTTNSTQPPAGGLFGNGLFGKPAAPAAATTTSKDASQTTATPARRLYHMLAMEISNNSL